MLALSCCLAVTKFHGEGNVREGAYLFCRFSLSCCSCSSSLFTERSPALMLWT
ncbi:unnamed protein product [Ixodes pacificus]